jgi:ElaB/YqjD/DUF883 family membrane-anchored ribosome-binding protein
MQDLPNEYAGTGTEPDAATGRARESGELKTAATRARRLGEEASQTLRSARDKVSAAYDRTADQASRAYSGARGYVQDNPGVAAATVFAAGLGIGMLIGARGAARAYRRGFVPGVVLALAQAVRDVFERVR